MVLIAVVFLVAVCLLIDWRLQRGVALQPRSAPVMPTGSEQLVLSPPSYVGGFQVQEEMAFHLGHAWAFAEGPDLVRVGMDDFAQKLIGRIDRIELPAVGDQVVQGQPAWTLHRQQGSAAMLSPFSGQVVEVNPRVRENPAALPASPYGEGWLFRVRAADMRSNLNNLLTGSLVRRWMEEVSARLRARLNHGMALSFPDGGTAVDDLAGAVPVPQWQELVREFLMSEA